MQGDTQPTYKAVRAYGKKKKGQAEARPDELLTQQIEAVMADIKPVLDHLTTEDREHQENSLNFVRRGLQSLQKAIRLLEVQLDKVDLAGIEMQEHEEESLIDTVIAYELALEERRLYLTAESIARRFEEWEGPRIQTKRRIEEISYTAGRLYTEVRAADKCVGKIQALQLAANPDELNKFRK